MRATPLLLAMCLALSACDGGGQNKLAEQNIPQTPEAKLCARAWSSWNDSLGEEATKRGIDKPKLLGREKFVSQCVGDGYTEEQSKCLDPKWRAGDLEGCKAALHPVKEKSDALLKALLGGAPPDEKKPEPKPADAPGDTDAAKAGEAPAAGAGEEKADVGSAVEEALGQ